LRFTKVNETVLKKEEEIVFLAFRIGSESAGESGRSVPPPSKATAWDITLTSCDILKFLCFDPRVPLRGANKQINNELKK